MKTHLFPFQGFVILFWIGTLFLLAVCAYKFIKWIRQFSPNQLKTVYKNWYEIFPALWEMVREGLIHVKIFKRNVVLGIMHQAFALGWFLLIVTGALESISAVSALSRESSVQVAQQFLDTGKWYNTGQITLQEAVQSGSPKTDYRRPLHLAIFYRYFVAQAPAGFKHAEVYANIMDALLLWIFLGLTLGFIKMFYSRLLGMKRTTQHNVTDLFAKFSLWAIFPLRFLAESVTATLSHNGGFLTQAMGDLFSETVASGLEMLFWPMYALALCIFFICMPFTRYMHIFAELFLIYFRKCGVREEAEPTGYTKFELNACSRCGICIDGCPLEKKKKGYRNQGVYLVRAIRNKRSKSTIRHISNDCLLCGRCTTACPVGIDLQEIRRLGRVQNMKRLDKTDGYSYLANSKVPFNAMDCVAYFGGCMSHLTPAITESMITIFKKAGVKYWYMDRDATVCCGRPLQQQGLTEQAIALREKNTDTIRKSGAKMLVTSCPICFQSFTKEYKLDIPVMHHTQFMDMLIKNGSLQVEKDNKRVSYHDPCELGRGCGVYDEPRSVLNAVTNLQKIKNEREKSICCGFNLGAVVLDTQAQTKVRDAALKNLTEKPVDAVVTACPMCKKALQRGNSEHTIKDIAEIVAENIKP